MSHGRIVALLPPWTKANKLRNIRWSCSPLRRGIYKFRLTATSSSRSSSRIRKTHHQRGHVGIHGWGLWFLGSGFSGANGTLKISDRLTVSGTELMYINNVEAISQAPCVRQSGFNFMTMSSSPEITSGALWTFAIPRTVTLLY